MAAIIIPFRPRRRRDDDPPPPLHGARIAYWSFDVANIAFFARKMAEEDDRKRHAGSQPAGTTPTGPHGSQSK